MLQICCVFQYFLGPRASPEHFFSLFVISHLLTIPELRGRDFWERQNPYIAKSSKKQIGDQLGCQKNQHFHVLALWIWFPAPERESELDFSNPCCKYHMFYDTFWVPDPPPRRFFALFANCLVWLSRTPPGAPPATWPDPEDDET